MAKSKGIPNIVAGVSFGNVDDSWRAPLHRKLGIETYTHYQAVLHSPFDGRRSGGWRKGEPVYAHWYRVPITLAKIG